MEKPFEDLGRRIRQARRALDLTQQDVADALKVTVQSVSQWETGRSRPEGDRMDDLAHMLGTDAKRLKADASETAPTDRQRSRLDKIIAVGDRYAEFLPSKEAAVDSLGMSLSPTVDTEMLIIAQYKRRGRLFAYPIDDDEMEPLFKAGDYVVLDTAVPLRVGDFALIVDIATSAVALREVRGTRLDDQDRLVYDFRALNPAYGPSVLTIEGDHNAILGTVVEHRRVRRGW